MTAITRPPLTADAPAAEEAEVPRDAHQAFTRYADFVWRTLQRLGVRDSDREDLTQQVFLVVHRQIGAFEGRSRMTTWLYGITCKVVAAHRRRGWVRREQATSELPERTALDADPEQRASDAQDLQALLAMLDRLDFDKRAVFVAHELDELTCEEIAVALGIPIGTVHSRLYQARQAFRAAIAREEARRANAPVPVHSMRRRR